MSSLTETGKASSKKYVHGDATFTESLAVVFKTRAMAVTAFRAVAVDKLADCFSSNLKTQSSGDVKVKDVSWGRVSFPHLGDRSAAYQIAIKIETHGITPTAYFDLVFIERKQALSILMFLDVITPFDETLEQRLSRAVAQRMKE